MPRDSRLGTQQNENWKNGTPEEPFGRWRNQEFGEMGPTVRASPRVQDFSEAHPPRYAPGGSVSGFPASG